MKRNQSTGSVPSMQNVAAYAGVSIATVSKVMQGDATVRAENVVAVQNAIEALGYRINPVAAELRRGRRKLIGVVLTHLDETAMALARALEFHAHRHGYAIWLEFSDGLEERENLLLGRMKDLRVAGFVLSQVNSGSGEPPLLLGDVATVSVGASTMQKFDGVTVKADAVAGEFVRMLVEAGCRDLLVVGRMDRSIHFDGFVHHLELAWGESSSPSLFRREILGLEPMRAAARLSALLDAMKRPSGVVVLDNAVQVMAAMYVASRGIKIPEDLRLGACGHPMASQKLSSPFVFVDYPADEVAAAAIDLLLLRIEDPLGSPAILEASLNLSTFRHDR